MLDVFAPVDVMLFLGRLEAAAARVADEPEVTAGFPMHESFELLWSDAVARKKQKHVVQESSLLAVMQRNGMSCRPGSAVVELGAGTGTFSLHMARAHPDGAPRSHFVLLDRQTFRSHRRVDGRLRALGMRITRHTLDVRDFEAAMLPQDAERFLFCSKHFCGPATDMALQLACTIGTNRPTAICLATCCHGIMANTVPFGGHVSARPGGLAPQSAHCMWLSMMIFRIICVTNCVCPSRMTGRCCVRAPVGLPLMTRTPWTCAPLRVARARRSSSWAR